MHASPERRKQTQQASSKRVAPVWIVWLTALLALAVILLGVGITTMVVLVERDRAVAQNPTVAAGDGVAAQVEPPQPGEIIILTPSPIPTNTAPPPTPTLIPTEAPTQAVIEVDREERSDLRPINPTPAPIITATVLPEGGVAALRTDTPFVIDGNLEGWVNVPSTVSTYTVFNQVWWDESNDLDAFWRLAWDKVNLYIGVVVVDDLHVQTQGPLTAYKGDSLELQIDTDLAGDGGALVNRDDFQLVLSPGNFTDITPGAFRFRGTDANRMEGAPGHAIVVSAVQTDNGYVLEAAVPWDDLDLRPVEDMVIGVSLNANDTDVPDAAVQEMMKSHVATRTFLDPSTWGTLLLTTD